MVPESLQLDALRRTNQALGFYGLEPISQLPAGTPLDPCDCPIKRGLSALDPDASVGRRYIITRAEFAQGVSQAFGQPGVYQRLDQGLAKVRLTRIPRRFISAFDERHLPELIDPVTDKAYQAYLDTLDAVLV